MKLAISLYMLLVSWLLLAFPRTAAQARRSFTLAFMAAITLFVLCGCEMCREHPVVCGVATVAAGAVIVGEVHAYHPVTVIQNPGAPRPAPCSGPQCIQ